MKKTKILMLLLFITISLIVTIVFVLKAEPLLSGRYEDITQVELRVTDKYYKITDAENIKKVFNAFNKSGWKENGASEHFQHDVAISVTVQYSDGSSDVVKFSENKEVMYRGVDRHSITDGYNIVYENPEMISLIYEIAGNLETRK